MAAKEDRRVTMTKRMLKDALLDMLKTESIHRISIRDLCERADINRTTFYKYYGSPYALLEDIEGDFLRNIEKSIRENANYSELLFSITRYIGDNIELSRLLINSNVDPEFPQKLFSLPSIVQIFKDNDLWMNDAETEYIYEYAISGTYGMIKRWLNKDGREHPQEMAEIMIRVFIMMYGSQHFGQT